MLFKLLGHYGHVLNAATLCTPKLTELAPDLANLNDMRCARVCEPDERLGFNVSTMKTLTGDRTINARNLYEKGKQPIRLRNTLLCECNKKPKLEGQMDEAVLRRIVDMPFRSSFVSDPQSSSTIAGFTTQFTDGADEDIRIAEDHFNIDIS